MTSVGPALASTSLVALSMAAAGPAAAAGPDCTQLTAPVYSRASPTLSTSFLTASAVEATRAGETYGFTDDLGTPFQATRTAGTGLSPVRRMWNEQTHDFAWAASDARAAQLRAAGYAEQKVDFYAVAPGTAGTGCTVTVKQLGKAGKHRYVTTAEEINRLVAQGWVDQGAAFTAAATTPRPTPAPAGVVPDTATAFSLAVIPDTQLEMGHPSDARAAQRADWLVGNRAALDLRHVVHTGDMVNWDDSNHSMFIRASDAMARLDRAGIAWTGSIGNHDTAAVCPGGSACPGQSASVNVRNTSTWNQYFPLGRFRTAGAFEPGKSDNTFSTFSAGGKQWLVLNLELWPRKEAVAWADSVVASHPKHNVIISTHAFLETDGSIGGYNGGYGATSPRYLYDQVIAKRPNVKMVFSGHVGEYSSRLQSTPSGNKVAMFMGTWHSRSTNPVRQVQIDPSKGQVISNTYGPATGETWSGANVTYTGLSFV